MLLSRRSVGLALAGAALLAGAGAVLRRGIGASDRPGRGDGAPRASGRDEPGPHEEATSAAAPGWELPLPPIAAGWEEAAETVALDLGRFLAGRATGGAYEEARAEAARADLALFPPEPARLGALLLSADPAHRSAALAALSVRGEATDDLVRLALRRARDGDDLVRLLAAELAVALPAEQLARHEEDLLRLFEREPNPLVLAVALPALERLEAPRLRALLEAQLGVASPEMVPVLAALARDRLGPEGLRSVGISVIAVRDRAGE